MNKEINKLVDKFVIETNMDDLEVEEVNEHYYLCNDVRQIGEIQKIDNEYCIIIEDEYLKDKGERFNSEGWCD
jgi:hypothetical protein